MNDIALITNWYPQLIGNLRREFLIWKSYRFNAVTSLLIWGIIFPLLMAIFQSVAARSNVTFGPAQWVASLVGFLAWHLCVTVLTSVPEGIGKEARTGTLESNLLSAVVSPFRYLLIRAITRSVFALAETLVLTLSLTLLFGLRLGFTPTAWLIVTLMLLGIWGISFAIAGLILLYKSVGKIVSLVTSLALIFSIVPLDGLGVVFTILKATFPLTWGIELLRMEMLESVGFFNLMHNGQLLGLTIQTALLLLGGYVLFNVCFRRAKEQGELGAY